MSGFAIAEGVALVIDLSSAGIGAVDNLIQIIEANGPIEFAASGAGLIASVTGPIPGVGAATNTVALTMTLIKAGQDTTNGTSVALGDVVSAIGGVVGIAGGLLALSSPLGWTALGISAVGSALTGIGFYANLQDMQDERSKLITDLQASFHTAETTVSPLILDLDGDGVETINKSAGIHFDHDGNHFAETTGWVGKDDGLLVWDKDGDGRIRSGSELFGNQTVLATGSNAANGFAALAELDSNSDGKVDASDTAFAQLRIWKDGDGNAVVSDGELVTLNGAGVQSLRTTYTAQSHTDAQGNQHLQVGQYTRTDGSSHVMTDVWFSTDLARTVDQDLVTVNGMIAALPELQGFGNVHSLRQAMARDASGSLLALVQEFISAAESNVRQALFQDILFAWAGSNQYSATSRGNYIDDGRKVYTLEAFLGEAFVQFQYSNPGPFAGAILANAFDDLSQALYSQLMLRTHFKSLYESIGLTWNAATSSFAVDVVATINQLRDKYNADAVTGIAWMMEFGQSLMRGGKFELEVLKELRSKGDFSQTDFDFHLATLGYNAVSGVAGNDALTGISGKNNWLRGNGGNDNIYGQDKDDVLDGGAGNDYIEGRAGNDLLTGGAGNDTIDGGIGNDTYVFSLGDGADRISEYDNAGNADKLQFGAGITASAIQLSRSGADLTLTVNAADKVTLTNYFYFNYGADYRIETIVFADDVTWDVATVAGMLTYNGTAGADDMVGISGYANRINGLGGNDNIYGQDKDDVLDGGAGNDTINGGSGNDTYVFNLGDGADTINDYDTAVNADKLQFGAGITASVIQLGRSGVDLTLMVNAADKVTLVGYFDSWYGANYRIETIAFADDVTWDVATVASMLTYNGTAGADDMVGISGYANRINGLDGNDNIYGQDKDDVLDGGAGNDTIVGRAGNDLLTGGAGNDTIDGGMGNDTYVFNLGDGADTINDYDTAVNADKLQFGAGITASAIQLSRSGDDLTLMVNAADKVTLVGYFDSWYGASYRIETIAFADGVTGDMAAVMSNLIYNGTAGAESMVGVSGYANRINGLDGNDSIYGQDKDDVLDGGAGNDTIEGRAGNDLLTGGAGNDTIDGGMGNDIFKFFTPNEGTDSITDFVSGTDLLQFVGSNFGLSPGVGVTLLSGATTASASGASAQFLYNANTGALYFDQDGAGTAYGALHIVTLTGQKTLVASDIAVVTA